MALQKRKEKKKKDREREAKAKVLIRRESLRKLRKADAEQQKREREANDIVHGKTMPIITNPQKLAERENYQANIVSEKLKRNLEILEALEREYEAEQAARSEMNEKLETEGHKTMREKMDALHKKALNLTGKSEELSTAYQNYDESKDISKLEQLNAALSQDLDENF